ncbi:hypothetical protein AB6N21_002929 [Thiohalocapsa marina]|nr:hypothetical protein [Thiohalocapsa marina]
MQQASDALCLDVGAELGDQLRLGGCDDRPRLVQRLMQGANAQVDPEPIMQQFLHARPREAKTQIQGDDEARQPQTNQAPFAQGNAFQHLLALRRLRSGAVATAAGHLQVAMIHQLQAQTRRARVAPVQIDRLESGVDRPRHLGRQRLPTPRTARRAMPLLALRLKHLRAAKPRRPRLFAGLASALAASVRGWLARVIQIGQQIDRQPAQRRLRHSLQEVFVELLQIVLAELHVRRRRCGGVSRTTRLL